MINRITLLLFFGLLYCSDQQIFFINHLVEQNGEIVRPVTNEPVIGDIYRYFGNGNMESKNVFIGTITTEGKNGNWIRWWDNGKKNQKDAISILLKKVSGLNGLKLEINILKYCIKTVR